MIEKQKQDSGLTSEIEARWVPKASAPSVPSIVKHLVSIVATYLDWQLQLRYKTLQ